MTRPNPHGAGLCYAMLPRFAPVALYSGGGRLAYVRHATSHCLAKRSGLKYVVTVKLPSALLPRQIQF